jgi:hypothetical protein
LLQVSLKKSKTISINFICNCGKEHVKNFKIIAYKAGAFCEECTGKNKKEKYKQTNLDIRGVENPMRCSEVKEKHKQTCIKKFDVENPSQSKLVKERKVETCLKNHGVTYPLNTPSAQQSGLKLQINQTLQPNVTYNFLIDFDVNHSIVVEAGNSGNYNLHPVLRVTTDAISGSITGTFVAGEFQVLASVMVGTEEVSAFTDEAGVFFIHGLPAGTYTLTLTPDPTSQLNPQVIENVIVVNEATTDIGTISLE